MMNSVFKMMNSAFKTNVKVTTVDEDGVKWRTKVMNIPSIMMIFSFKLTYFARRLMERELRLCGRHALRVLICATL